MDKKIAGRSKSNVSATFVRCYEITSPTNTNTTKPSEIEKNTGKDTGVEAIEGKTREENK
jgi:hypothetical protein